MRRGEEEEGREGEEEGREEEQGHRGLWRRRRWRRSRSQPAMLRAVREWERERGEEGVEGAAL